jgi:myosin-1
VDIKFLQKAEQTVSNPHFIPRNNNFTIKHYAGDVTYDVDGKEEGQIIPCSNMW